MSFWSTQTLLAELPNIIAPFKEGRTKQAAYRLSMGPEYYVTPNKGEKFGSKKTRKQLHQFESMCIPPGQFAFLLTDETITMPNDAIGFISMKTEIKFRGLVNISGFHVDPGSSGKLIFSVFNAGPKPIHIARGDDIFRLWISSLDKRDAAPRTEPSHKELPSEYINNIAGSLDSLENLSKRLDNVKKTLAVFMAIASVAVAISGALLAKALFPDMSKSHLTSICSPDLADRAANQASVKKDEVDP